MKASTATIIYYFAVMKTHRKVPAAAWKAAAVAAALLCQACPGRGRPPAVPKGKLVLEVTPGHAHVYLDERLQGTASMLGGKTLLVSTGRHRLKLDAENYFTECVEILVTEDVKKIEVEMRKIPPPVYP